MTILETVITIFLILYTGASALLAFAQPGFVGTKQTHDSGDRAGGFLVNLLFAIGFILILYINLNNQFEVICLLGFITGQHIARAIYSLRSYPEDSYIQGMKETVGNMVIYVFMTFAIPLVLL